MNTLNNNKIIEDYNAFKGGITNAHLALDLLFKNKQSKIRLANLEDLDSIMEVIEDARALFKSKGSTQWQDSDGYPNRESFTKDILNKALYVFDDGLILGVCAITFDIDHNYDVIEGKWLNDDKYSVIHRIATRKNAYNKGIAKAFFEFAEKISIINNVYNIKADTGVDNDIMINLFNKYGYTNCGKIYLLRDTVIDKLRIGFQKELQNTTEM